ncbi:hypothetical protein B0H65DRAFT_439790 [Neurospora tetraspora]|uniref:Uncharacterized protein n=1 Tax=Neurospora tetraspora TaxID=94610 RepID=A0AAE0JJI4_9PEZI|nr:hypothetical protein B0H65DRAFT_439790 [Neurospora tetraspora]
MCNLTPTVRDFSGADRQTALCQLVKRTSEACQGPGVMKSSRTIGQCTFPHSSDIQIAEKEHRVHPISPAQSRFARQARQASPEFRRNTSHRGKCKGLRGEPGRILLHRGG